MSDTPERVAPTPDSARDLAREVLVHGPISRSELGSRLGLSPASLTRLSKPFLDHGIFVEGPERADGGVGRPVKPLDVRVDARRFIGVKITGDAVLGVSTDLRAAEIERAEVTFANQDLTAVVDSIATVVELLGGPSGFHGIGISLGGNVTDDGIVQRAPFLGWRQVDLRTAVATRLGLRTTVENDVVALTAAEHWFGAGRGLTNFAVLTIGVGVGYGLVINDQVVRTQDTGLGLLGHVPLDPTGPLCKVGHRGCAAAMLTMGSMCAQAEVALGRPVDYPELLRLASTADPVARAIVDAAGRALGRLIASVANFAMVSSVVLAGEGLGLLDVLVDSLAESIDADRDPEGQPVTLLRDDRDFTPWARGAAAVAIQESIGALRR